MDGDDSEANALVDAVVATTREAIMVADRADDASQAWTRPVAVVGSVRLGGM